MLSGSFSFSSLPNPTSHLPDPFGRSRAAVFRAGQLFQAFFQRGKVFRLWQRVTRQPWELAHLSAQSFIRGRYGGIQTIPLRQVMGSESRGNDFDRGFHPIHEKNFDRWRNIAICQLLYQCLPPVELIQMGAVYYVRDGHHRISVARALGQRAIEAVVTCLQGCEAT